MSELPVTVRAGEPGLVSVGHQVVVEAVLAGEGRPTQAALEWPQSSVAPDWLDEVINGFKIFA